ncbi:hypothetical protein FQN54_005216 [Arachnomyces sp. PD_36]|nr:hypothetical protein FQN54_005216 [Arachnomyces sp. PD_36]
MAEQAQYHFGSEYAQEKEYAQARERKHSSLCALMDPELLVMHAVSRSETIPQTRRRLLSELIGAPAAAELEMGGESGDVPAGDRMSSNGYDGRQQWRSVSAGSSNGQTMGFNGQRRSHHSTSKQPPQSTLRFGDCVVVNVVETEGGWVENEKGKKKGKGKGKERERDPRRESGRLGRSVSAGGSESASGGMSGGLSGVD